MKPANFSIALLLATIAFLYGLTRPEIWKLITENNQSITAFAAAMTTVVTGGLVWLGYQQNRTTRRQLRAYISVVIGDATPQNRSGNLLFEARPVLYNAGNTPAYKVSYEIKAEIITHSMAATYTFDPPSTGQKSETSVGPRESRTMGAVVPYFVNDGDVADIKIGNGKSLWVWGKVTYEDVFGESHYTQFCQRLLWNKEGNVYGYFDPRFGKSD